MRISRYCAINHKKTLNLFAQFAVPFRKGKWRDEGVTTFDRNSVKA